MKILLGVSGGVAAYKAAELTRLLQERGHRVQAILTRAAREFVQPLTFAALTGERVLTDLFGDEAAPGGAGAASIEHIAVAQSAAALLVAPATANCLARFAHGLADDYLSTVFLATPAPVILAPAMNLRMWLHAATQANLDTLRARGVTVVEPGKGYLACGMVGAGRMAELEAIVNATEAALNSNGRGPDWAGETVLVTAGPTREALDPVRFLSNRSSGRMGYALAAAAAARGAKVYLVSGPVDLPAPAGVETLRVTTAAEMAAAAEALFDGCTVAVLTAAVADYRPAAVSPGKIKKTEAGMNLALERTPDILATLGRRKRGQHLIGFAAETDSAGGLALARAKLAAKRADLIVLNDVSRTDIGFEVDQNEVTLVTPDAATPLARAAKREIADLILDAVLPLLRHDHHHARGPAEDRGLPEVSTRPGN